MKSEVFHILAQTISQSFLSALASVGVGLLCAWGLLAMPRGRAREGVQILFLLPSVLPSLYIVTAALELFQFFKIDFYGLWAVVLVHTLINMGLVGVTVLQIVESKMGNMLELALIEGARRVDIIMAALRYLYREMMLICFYVFTASFVSLSVPLLIGGGSGATLEVYIYRLAMAQGQYQQAIWISIGQIILLALFSLFLLRPWPWRSSQNLSLRPLGSAVVLVIGIGVSLLLIAASMGGLVYGAKQILSHTELLTRLPMLLSGSFIECIAVSLMVFAILNLYILVWPATCLHRFSLGVSAPSTVLIALFIYSVFDAQAASNWSTLAVVSFGYMLTIWPTLYRLRGYEVLRRLEEQMTIAKMMGASRLQIYRDIALPQAWSDFAFVSGVAAFWASGDFALSSMVVGRDLTLAMLAQTLVGGYRVEVATAITWLALAVGVIVFVFFQGVGRVGYKKSRT